ncbi:MAG: helix-turn-helix transcriptional regulator [Gemmatimonadota bacterium]
MMRLKLKELLDERGGPSQAELARRIGVPRQQVNRLVNGGVERIDLKTLDRLYTALGCGSVDELIEYTADRRDVSGFRERFVAELVALTLSSVQGDHRGIYSDPAVRRAAEGFFDEHIARDLSSGGLLAGLHARLMRHMRGFVSAHGARDAAGPPPDTELEKLVREIAVHDLARGN